MTSKVKAIPEVQATDIIQAEAVTSAGWVLAAPEGVNRTRRIESLAEQLRASLSVTIRTQSQDIKLIVPTGMSLERGSKNNGIAEIVRVVTERVAAQNTAGDREVNGSASETSNEKIVIGKVTRYVTGEYAVVVVGSTSYQVPIEKDQRFRPGAEVEIRIEDTANGKSPVSDQGKRRASKTTLLRVMAV